MVFFAANEKTHRHRRKQQLKGARDLAAFGSASVFRELQEQPGNEELLAAQLKGKQLDWMSMRMVRTPASGMGSRRKRNSS